MGMLRWQRDTVRKQKRQSRMMDVPVGIGGLVVLTPNFVAWVGRACLHRLPGSEHASSVICPLNLEGVEFSLSRLAVSGKLTVKGRVTLSRMHVLQITLSVPLAGFLPRRSTRVAEDRQSEVRFTSWARPGHSSQS